MDIMTCLKKLQLCILCGLIGALLLDYYSHDLKQLYAIIVTYAVSSVYIFICIKILKLNNKVTLISAITLSAIVMFIFLHVLPQFTMWQIELYVIFYQKIGTVFQILMAGLNPSTVENLKIGTVGTIGGGFAGYGMYVLGYIGDYLDISNHRVVSQKTFEKEYRIQESL